MKLEDIGMLAVTFLVTAIIIGLGSVILTGFQANVQNTISPITGNQSLTWAGNNTPIPLLCGKSVPSSMLLYNNGSLVNQGASNGQGNYTVQDGTITITNYSATNPEWVTARYNASYSCYIGSVAYNATTYGNTTLNTIASYLPLLGLIVIAAVVVGIVLMMFLRRSM